MIEQMILVATVKKEQNNMVSFIIYFISKIIYVTTEYTEMKVFNKINSKTAIMKRLDPFKN